MSAPSTHFFKYHGIGNDFIVIDSNPTLSAEQAQLLCDRSRGIGADGVLLLWTQDGMPFMRVINSDGSIPEMCGNGIRCAALHLRRTAQIQTDSFQINTDAGLHEIHTQLQNIDFAQVRVQMQIPSLEARAIPLTQNAPLVDQDLEIEGTALKLTAVSMGNPHAVTFDVFSEAERLRIAPHIQHHPLFQQGANVGFASIDANKRIALYVYERGAGWTQACGTGACAAAVAAVVTGRLPAETSIEVDLPGGTLQISVGPSNTPLDMRGPAAFVFDGHIKLEQKRTG